ncbi:MAG TPA: tripartite tricarboxylate transporter permease [Anaerolineae bacterium]|nr:tripartite tricarboxylate transporter permease [Anaerolineae bacterium]HPL29275.1 tripartite tricarboxylate transporter permease [Anaerolineae bacterium]
MIDSFFQALLHFTNPQVLLTLFAATLIGLILGVLPGVTGGFGIIVLLPFILGLDPMFILPIIIAFAATAGPGGAITSILLGIPGEPSNAAAILDGYPMTKKGEGLRAVGAAVTTCWMSNLASVVFALGMVPLIVPIIMQFKAPETCLMIAVAICFISAVTRGSRLKGLISACIGLLLSTIGFQAKTGVARFTFGSLYLYDGIGLIMMVLGCFALPVLVEMIAEEEPPVPQEAMSPKGMHNYRELFRGVQDVFRHFGMWLRTTIMGYIVGVIPGVGGETSPWIGYAHAKQCSKNPETFGEGNVEGVIGAESANNAKTGGDLLTTLALGIPGSGKMVFILAALVLVGIQPGPWVIMRHTTLAFTMLQTVAVTSIMAAIVLYACGPYMLKLVQAPIIYQFAFLVPLVYISVNAGDGAIMDIFILALIAIVAHFLKKHGYFLSALVMGFILGGLFEYYLWQSLDLVGPTFFISSPICIALLISMPLILYYEDIRDWIARRRTKNTELPAG